LPGELEPRPPVESIDDRRAALALSVTNVPSLEEGANAYIRALRCSLALKTITQRIAEGGSLSAEQMRLLRQVQLNYEREFARLGAQEGKSPAGIRNDHQQQGQQVADPTVAGRIALGCLRERA